MQTLIDFAATGTPGSADPLRCAFGAPRQTLVAHRPAQVRPLLEAVQALARQGYWCVGYLRYEAAAAFDPALAVQEADGPLAWFGVHDAPQAWPDLAVGNSAIAQWQEALSRSAFDQGMAEIHRAIVDGELYQLNYTAPLHGTLTGAPRDLFMALQRAQPGGYAAFIDTGDEQVLSVSPELFFDWDGERILARPMKGTAPRGATAEIDAALAAQLLASAKERAENVMIVDLIRNDLSRVAQPFSVTVPHLFQLEALPSVWQMTSDVEARTRPGTTLADVFAALFPCGSITGAPKVRAMQMIKSLEPEPRGVYCGAVGVVRPGGAATFNVAIRTVTVQGDALRCGIGSGITADATAEGEWQEWRHKRAFLERARQPFELLETMALEDGVLRTAPEHLARLARAAQHFGYPWAATRVEACLRQLADSHRQGLWRVRLRLDAHGQAQAEAYAMEVIPTPVTLALAATAFEAADSEFVRFKTTRRAHYDAFAPHESGVFDTLLWNRQGEITECTRGNVALRLDGRWVTPPLRCGLLDGIGRARFLREGRLAEAVVRVEDLPRATGLAFVNSLRGWLDAVLV
ncbi:MAG: aminodeoxychorismate synthase component I [Rhodoferax sp.]|uniref:aminodeoxychorismate synthase component I n=1 Tax=Rhodoferax sp. TaxID=50421 RepID=UPI0018396EEB|nr:aminodeoxychorismate synthase component I [Rhodoferax sp.]NMM12184.1 aminodeoxychorismate synthase component I [Rhodoferax sp.]NMM20143.1 aminodeoxychorismate synthase component I [Rhodoferax sp.]